MSAELDHHKAINAELLAALNAALDKVDADRAEGIEQPAWAEQARAAVAKAL